MNKNLTLAVFICCWMMIYSSETVASENQISTTLQSLIEVASEMKLAEQPAWLNLLHYKKGLGGDATSQADDSRFFLSAQGGGDARAELEASLRGFYLPIAGAPKPGVHEQGAPGAEHPRCRFPARLHWLDSQLGFKHELPALECQAFNEWKTRFQASGLTLLFPSMYLRNPASMFGHTFLRFDQSGNKQLLSQTLSYAAHHDESDPFISYAWKGITGGYPGRFVMQPYYETLQKYSDIEQRDIWEYKLNLTTAEIEQLVRHLWEIKGIHFEYFFLRENCSYRLLALLDVAREGVNLSLESHPVFAAPVDIVRDIDSAKMIEKRIYRPARQTRIKQMVEQLGEPLSSVAIGISDRRNSIDDIGEQFSRVEKAKALRLADELISGNIKQDPKSGELQYDVLNSLSQLGVSHQQTSFVYSAEPPENSHQTSRWQLSVGEYEQERFYEIGFRPVLHDALDSSLGLIKGATVGFLDTKVRWYEDSQALQLQRLNLIELRSLYAVNAWDKRLSAQLTMEIIDREISTEKHRTVFKTEVGAGYAIDVNQMLLYSMLNARLDYSPRLEDHHAGYLGAEAGALWQSGSESLSAQLEIKIKHYQQLSGLEGDFYEAGIGLQFNLEKENALRLEAKRTEYETFERDEYILSYLYYF